MSEDLETRKRQVRAMFDRLAPAYDQVGPAIFAHFGRRLVEAATIEPGMRVLDVACGRGAVLFPAAERLAGTGSIEGIDISPVMIETTIAAARRLNLQVRPRVMDAEQLVYPDSTFDRVFVAFAVAAFPNAGLALGEVRRVLDEGGELAVSTWRDSHVEAFNDVLPEMGFERAGEPGLISEPDHLSALLDKAGYRDISVNVETAPFEFESLEQYWQCAMTTGLRRRLEALTLAQQVDCRERVARRLGLTDARDRVRISASAIFGLARR